MKDLAPTPSLRQRKVLFVQARNIALIALVLSVMGLSIFQLRHIDAGFLASIAVVSILCLLMAVSLTWPISQKLGRAYHSHIWLFTIILLSMLPILCIALGFTTGVENKLAWPAVSLGIGLMASSLNYWATVNSLKLSRATNIESGRLDLDLGKWDLSRPLVSEPPDMKVSWLKLSKILVVMGPALGGAIFRSSDLETRNTIFAILYFVLADAMVLGLAYQLSILTEISSIEKELKRDLIVGDSEED
jgi:hypothetical protein